MKLLIKNKYTFLLIIVLLIGLIIRVRISQDHFVHNWDERYHALVAKNMIKHPLKPTLYDNPILAYDYKVWYANHIWLHKQPLPLWLIATSYSVFGVGDFTTRIPSLIFSVLAIFITYLLGKRFFGKNIGILSAFFIGINGFIIEIGAGRVATDHYDTLFMVFIEISILFAYYNSLTKKGSYSFLSGFFLAMAVLTKWLPCLVVLILHYCFLKNRRYKPKTVFRQICISIFTCLLFALPWQLYILFNYPAEAKWEYFHNWLHISQELDGQTGSVLYYLDKIRINYSEIIYVPLIYLIYKLIKNRANDYRLLALFLWIFIPVIFFSLVKTKMQGYILFISPALFIITAYFFFELKNKLVVQIEKGWVKVFSALVLIAIIILPVRYCFERTSFGFEKPKHVIYIDDYKKFIGQLPENAIVLNVKEPIEFMFYNNCIAYSTNQLGSLDKEKILIGGYKLFYFDEKNCSIQAQ